MTVEGSSLNDELPTTARPGMSTGAFQPRNERELAETMRGCSKEGHRVRLSGGGLVAKSGSKDALCVWMFGITGVVDIRADDLVATARAGTSIFEIDQELRERGRRFPLRPHDSGDRATVGGAFAAAADGLCARLGLRARDVLLGARAVLGNGDTVEVGARVVKSVAGFDVCKALVGSRGCLAALTEVTFRIETVPEVSVSLSGTFQGRVPAHAALAVAGALPLQPSALVVSPRFEGLRVDALLEGPRAAVASAKSRLVAAGFAEGPGDWPALTSLAAMEPAATHVRVVGRAPRTEPLTAMPRDAAMFVIDMQRGRFYAHVKPRRNAGRAPDPLLDRVRAAFDPGSIFEPGRGLGAA